VIPKAVHRIWLGPASLPPSFSDATASWRKFFPDYELMLWRDKDMAELRLPSLWFSAQTYAERADIARYRIMSMYGGIYADCDVVPLTRFDFLWCQDDTDVVFEEAPARVMNGLFVCKPGSMVPRLASGLSARSARGQSADAAPNVRTGPYVFSAAVSYARDIMPHGIRVYPPGFVHVRGAPEAYAVASAPFREPPAWVEVADHAGSDGRSRLELSDFWSEAALLARLLPVRVRRRLRGWREEFGVASR
jgi:hypothetical protein